jgi:hypothetical protein
MANVGSGMGEGKTENLHLVKFHNDIWFDTCAHHIFSRAFFLQRGIKLRWCAVYVLAVAKQM